jgi:hypothetical protein
VNGISIYADGLPARKYNIVDIPSSFIGSLWAEHPGISTLQTNVWFIKIEQRKTQSVDAARCRVPDAMIEHQPALRSFNRRGTEPNLVRIRASSITL